MNPLTNVRNIQLLNQKELQLGLTSKSTSWHQDYKDSAWLFIGGLPYDLTEGDIICVFSQYGEIVNINLVRDKGTGKSKGYAFLCYEDQRSTILAVDNLNSYKLLERTLRVDHVKEYRIPKEFGDEDETTLRLRMEGCGPETSLCSQTEAISKVKRLPSPPITSSGFIMNDIKIKKEKQDQEENDYDTISKESTKNKKRNKKLKKDKSRSPKSNYDHDDYDYQKKEYKKKKKKEK